MDIKRGDIWYVMNGYSTGSEQRSGRPAIIVSNEKNNEHSNTVEVVYLTTQPKRDLPTHANIKSMNRESIAICEQISTVAIERLSDYYGHITPEEMANVEKAMLISLDLQTNGADADTALASKLTEAELKRDMFQQLYDALLNKLVGK